MSRARLIALRCKIIRGVVSDERAFEIALADGRPYSGVAPVHYFWDVHGGRIPDNVPVSEQEVAGKVAARLLETENGTALVSIPDGAVVPVTVDQVVDRPSEVVFNVPVGPRS